MDLAGKEIQFIPGVGPARAECLKKELGVSSQEDLLYCFPYKYIDRTRLNRISELTTEPAYVQLKGHFLSFDLLGVGRSKRLKALFSDGTGTIELVWFKGIRYVEGKFKPGSTYIVFGKTSVFNHQVTMAHPDVETVGESAAALKSGLQPYYFTTEVMKAHQLNSKAVRTIIANLIRSIQEPLPETLPSYLVDQQKLMPFHEAMMQMHLPGNQQLLKQARYRLIFEELFYLQLHIFRYTRERERKFRGFPFERVGTYFNTFYHNHLPFPLTNAQKRVIKEIRSDLAKPRQMNRLLQGDVGSGKTLVALMTMLIAADNGFQSAIMAPTEILANQHYQTIRQLLGNMDLRVCLLTGSTKPKDRKVLHEELRSGTLQLLIGTHALIEETVQFHNLGLVIIDEQHRFGVEQRSRLWLKNHMPPHVLVMTATPIPRTLAMTVYGDLDVSVIDELPPGRKPIKTSHQFDNKRAPLYAFMREQLLAGRQIYVVYPLIQESKNMDYKNLEEGFDHLKEVFPDVSIGMVHGKMSATLKEEQMQAFVQGKTRILVATTVIEVGVNVPNASVMLIESAERFGLSQLHQLRGRVGRGSEQSFCMLVTSFNLSEDSRKRIEIMCTSNDGFEIAEADLRLRGPGDLEGTQQSGIPFDLKIANLARDQQITEYVRNLAKSLLADDPDLSDSRHQILSAQLKKRFSHAINWGVIS